MNKIITATLMSAGTLLAALSVPPHMEADFNQSVVNADGNGTLMYSGHLFARLPDRAKWIYKTPIPKTVCLDHDRAWVIEPDLEQATLYRMNKAIPLLAILKKAKPLGNGKYKAVYDGVEYLIEADGRGYPKAISYDDELGNRVTLHFGSIQTRPFNDEKLSCDIPEGYDIIDGRF